jgi:hypothetical protein
MPSESCTRKRSRSNRPSKNGKGMIVSEKDRKKTRTYVDETKSDDVPISKF